jgi:hypothetical protein
MRKRGSGRGRKIEAQAMAALARLAHEGAYAARAGAAARGAYALYSPRNGFAEPVATVSGAAIARALASGWLQRDTIAKRLSLAVAGLRALRGAKSAKATPPPQSEPAAPLLATREGTLAWLRRRRDKQGQPLITEAQYAAGERLAVDYWRAQLAQRVTASWSSTVSSGRMRRATPGIGTELSDGVVAARDRVNRALATVGPELAGILLDVCCHDQGLEAAERAHGWPLRAGKVVLQLALTRLARHYGLIAPEQPAAMRHWGDEGYKPTLGGWR